MTDSPLRGRLLVSQPTLKDSNFDRTVVFVLEHSDDGAVGLVLNRPSQVELAEALPLWAEYAATPPVVFAGGPVVEEDTAICLARAGGGAEANGWKAIADGFGTVDVNRTPAEIGVKVHEIRLFAGYSGWGRGQLEMEISMGGWFVVDARPVDAFTADPEGLWKAVLGRQQGMLAWMATFPPDIQMN
jgi:putative transcriptional regulator